MRILIVEDADYVSLTMKQLLPSHEVVTVREFVSLVPLVGRSAGGLHMFEKVSFDLAFVDGCFSTDFEGPGIVRMLREHSVTCVAMSVESQLNAEMLKEGAVITRGKSDLLKALHLGKLPVERLLDDAQTVEGELNELLKTYEQEHAEDHRALRKMLEDNVAATAKNYRRQKQEGEP